MPKLQNIYHLALGDKADYSCVAGSVSKLKIENKLETISKKITSWSAQRDGVLFIAPAPYKKLEKRKDEIIAFNGKIYIAPNDAELNNVQNLFEANENVTILYSNLPNFKGDHVARLIDTLICEDIRVKFPLEQDSDDSLWQEAMDKHLVDFQHCGKVVGLEYNNKLLDGSISMRFGSGFIVTASKTDKSKIKAEDLVVVTSVGDVVKYQGKRMPSSESLLHHSVFSELPDTKVVVHPHCKLITEHPDLENVRTNYFIPYGTPELAKTVVLILKKGNFAILRHHGEIVIGDNFGIALKTLEKIKEKLKK